MVLGEDLESLLVLATRYEPTRTLGKEENKDDLDGRWCSLHQTGESPRPVADDTECAVGDPATKECAKVVHGAGDVLAGIRQDLAYSGSSLVQSSDLSSLKGMCEFGDEKRRSQTRDTRPHSNCFSLVCWIDDVGVTNIHSRIERQ